jgi:hypothetical protein
MRCVPDALSRLFPEINLSLFPARDVGYGLGDIQRMLPNEYSIWPIYVNHNERAVNANVLDIIPKTQNKIPLFIFLKRHCVYAIWSRSEIIVYENNTGISWDADHYFRRNKVYQIAAIARYSDYNLLTLKP